MAKATKTGAAPVSKYAAKRAAIAEANKAAKEQTTKPTVTETEDAEVVKEVVKTPRPRITEAVKDKGQPIKDTDKTVTHVTPVPKADAPVSNISKFKINSKNRNPDLADPSKYADHMIELVLIVKHNAEIRRFTSLNIINYLNNKGIINERKAHVAFRWNKFTVKFKGLSRDYAYTETFFINALIASFSNFSASAQKAIGRFAKAELRSNITEVIDMGEINEHVNNHANA